MVGRALAAAGGCALWRVRGERQVATEPWGQRRFMVQDPSGFLVDVVEQIEPAAGFWDQYMG